MARRQTRRHRSRQSSFGHLMSPIDVRSSKDLKGFMDRVKKGPLTIVLVYADWCGHCKNFMPHFDMASKTPNRSVQVAKVSDVMVDKMNETLVKNNGKPVSVEGYPSVIAISPAVEKVTEIEPRPDTDAMKKVMEKTGNVAVESGLSVPKESIAPSPATNIVEQMNVANVMNMTIGEKKNNANSANNSKKVNKNTDILPEQEAVLSLPNVVANEETPVEPPVESDILRNSESNTMKGGSLYRALATTAYKLAPAGVLMGLASVTLKRSSKSQHRRRKYRHRITRRKVNRR
jgi:thiol-disulfide isomerase/thioredoxin